MAFAGAPTRLSFSKFEGLGNDFLVIDLRGHGAPSIIGKLQDKASAYCDRRRGVGADGLLLVTESETDDALARMIVINADGSRPEMCGNGLRCVVHYLGHGLGHGLNAESNAASSAFGVQTDNGVLGCELELQSPDHAQVTVHMGPAKLGETHHPKAAPERAFMSVSTGNPHAIHWVGASEDPQALAQQLGAAIECDAAYPERSNIEFVKDTPEALVCWVWERGCGITSACGTGACATAAAAVASGKRKAQTPIRVQLPGGPLEITVPQDPDASVVMRGPSRWVFDGQLPWSP